jgi:glycerophosphoryl diester phosphodiesterase
MFQAPVDIDGISVNSPYVTATLAATARKRGHILYAWTVNDRFRMQRLYHLGVDGIITDNPSLLHKMLS